MRRSDKDVDLYFIACRWVGGCLTDHLVRGSGVEVESDGADFVRRQRDRGVVVRTVVVAAGVTATCISAAIDRTANRGRRDRERSRTGQLLDRMVSGTRAGVQVLCEVDVNIAIHCDVTHIRSFKDGRERPVRAQLIDIPVPFKEERSVRAGCDVVERTDDGVRNVLGGERLLGDAAASVVDDPQYAIGTDPEQYAVVRQQYIPQRINSETIKVSLADLRVHGRVVNAFLTAAVPFRDPILSTVPSAFRRKM